MTGLSNDNLFSLQAGNALTEGRGLPKVGRATNIQEARKVAEDFEAVFLGQMLKPMFENIEAVEPFGGSSSERMWRTMQVEEYGKALAKSGGVGLADAVFREILKTQELR